MPNAFYKLGARTLLQRLSLQKPEDHTVRNVAVGAAAASPFMGLIGQKPLIHDPFTNPNIPRVSRLKDLEKKVQQGDILVMTKPGTEGWKLPQLLGGTEFYHGGAVPSVEPYRGKARPRVLAESGHLGTEGLAETQAPRVLRKKLPWFTPGLDYSDYSVVALRPKVPLTPEQLAAFEESVLKRSTRQYDTGHAVKNWFRDIFVPKTKFIERLSKPTVCEGNVCSTLPAQAYHEATGKSLLPGVAPQHIMSADLLRSPELTPVAARISEGVAGAHLSPRTLQAIRLGGRGALGLGLGGATYALSDDPALAAMPLGMAATPGLARRLVKHRLTSQAQKKSPRALSEASRGRLARVASKEVPYLAPNDLMNLIGSATKKERMLLRRALTRSLPLALAGGAATYLGAKGIEHLVGSKKK